MLVLHSTSNLFLIDKRRKIGIFQYCSSWTFQFFPIHERDGKSGFLNVSLGCTSKFLPIY